MKRLNTLLIGVVSVGLSAGVMAADEKDVKVTASVLQNCKVNSAQDIGFGTLDPAQALDTVATGQISFSCTKDVDYALTADNGTHYDGAASKRQMKGDGQNFLPYGIAESSFAGKGMGFSNPVGIVLTASILGSDYRDLPADNYLDTLRVSINP